MVDNSLISIIIPVYNVEKYLVECLNSVVNQDYLNIEVLLIDDGSTDGSPMICDEFASKYSKFKVVHKSNGGLSDARNTGIDLCRGDYLVFIDSDDIVSSNYVSTLYSQLIENSADISICDIIHTSSQSDVNFCEGEFVRIFDSKAAIQELLYQKTFLVSACGKMFSRSMFTQLRFKKGILFEDSALMYLLFDNAGKIVHSNAKIYGYVHRESSITTTVFTSRDLVILDICDDIDDFCASRGQDLIQAARSYHISAALRVYLNAPRDGSFDKEIAKVKKYISRHSFQVLFDARSRIKNRIAVLLFVFARPLLFAIYSKVDRWK